MIPLAEKENDAHSNLSCSLLLGTVLKFYKNLFFFIFIIIIIFKTYLKIFLNIF